MSRKLLLVNPPWSFCTTALPANLVYLSSYVSKCNPEVEQGIVDLNLFLQGHATGIKGVHLATKYILDKSPDYVGISCHVMQVPFVLSFIEALNMNLLDIKIIVGGYYPSSYPQLFLEKGADYVVTGPGEVALSDIVAGKSAMHIGGVWHKSENGCIVSSNTKARISPINPVLDVTKYRLLPLELYAKTNRYSQIDIIGSLGCNYTCTFCSQPRFWEKHTLLREPMDVVTEIQYLSDAGISDFELGDNNLCGNIEWFDVVMTALAKLNTRWSALTRIDQVTPSILKTMARAGCVQSYAGLGQQEP